MVEIENELKKKTKKARGTEPRVTFSLKLDPSFSQL